MAAAANKPAIPQVKTPSNTVDPKNVQKESKQEDKASTASQRNGEATSSVPLLSAMQAGQLPSNLNRMMKATAIDDRSAPTSSVENLGKKDSSDTKSVTSRTTLTLDEKESLRPDDSASMQGAQDEDVVSPADSLHAGVKLDVNPDVRAFRDQLYEIDKHGGKRVHLAQRPVSSGSAPQQQNGTAVYPPIGPTPHVLDVDQARDQAGGPPAGLVFPPDDKLVEALNSPKDRLFVLKIEQDFIDFIKSSKEIELQLPSTNTFYRLLSHKLAEYYLLGHVYEDSLRAVRIRKLPYTRLAPPLIGCEPKSEGATPPPTSSMKIMRRGQPGQVVPTLESRPQSSSEHEGLGGLEDENDGQKRPRDKSALTREEREKQYNEVRARIFEGFNENQLESTEGSANHSKEMSRSSSHSGAKKNKRGKRPKDDSFEARSSYTSVDGQAFVNNSLFQPPTSGQYYGGFASFPQYTGIQPQYQAQAQNFQTLPQDFNASGAWAAPQQYGQQFSTPQAAPGYGQFSSQQYDQSTAYYGSPNTASQSTPKAQHPGLAGYFPQTQAQTQAHVDNISWAQSVYQPGFTQQSMFDQDQSQNAYMIPYSFDPNMQFMQGYNVFNSQQFNPHSQSFIPGAHTGPIPSWQQPPQTPSNFSSPHVQQASPVRNGQTSNGRGKGNKGIGQPQQQAPSQPSQNSISKWAAPSSLPAKPPPTTSSLSFQMPKRMEQGQPLPSKPLGASSRS